jgi:hypothetical protein
MTTWSEFKEVQAGNVEGFHTGDVTEGFGESLILAVNDEGTTTLDASSVTHFTNTSAVAAGFVYLLNVIPDLQSAEEGDSLLGLVIGLDVVGDNEGYFRSLLDQMTLGHDERRNRTGSQGRGNSISLLVGVHTSVPVPPGLGRGEHTSTTTHVPESSLTRTVSTTSTDTGNTSNSTTSSPRLSRCLVTSIYIHSIRLPRVLANVLVNKVDDVRSDGSLKDSRHGDGGAGEGILLIVDR